MAKMSKEMPLKVFAKKFRFDPKEEEWILKNDKDTHYYNNSALPKAWSSLSYPIYNGDYYFAFIHDKPRVNAQYNAKANRELRKYIKSTLNADEIFDKMEKYFEMQFKDAGSGDTMTREELWTAIVDMRKKNPVKESVKEQYLKNLEEKREFKQSDIDKVAKLTDRNEHTKSLIHIAKVMGDKRSFKKLELIDKLHNEYGHLHSGLKSMRDEVYQDLKDGMKKYDNGQDMYGAT